MKKLIFIISIFSSFSTLNSQCVPDSAFTNYPIGIYCSDSIEIGNYNSISLTLSLDDGSGGYVVDSLVIPSITLPSGMSSNCSNGCTLSRVIGSDNLFCFEIQGNNNFNFDDTITIDINNCMAWTDIFLTPFAVPISFSPYILNLYCIPDSTLDIQTACNSLTWIDGVTYSASNNTATHNLNNAVGCYSVVTLDLTINYSTTGNDVQTSCGNLTWIDGVNYTTSNNSAIHTLTNAAGCDSIVSLNLTINSDDFNLAISATQQVFTAPPFAAVFTNNTPNMSDYTFTWDFGDDSTLQTNNSNVFHEYIYNGLYEVKLMADNNTTGCRDTLAEQDFIYTSGGPSLSIIEVYNNINVFPNPTNENITISVSNYNGNIKTEVFDLIGNRLQTTNETTISLQDYARGIYLLKVAYGDRVEEVKVIKY